LTRLQRLTHTLRTQGGVETIEAVITLPVALLVLMAIVQYGLLMYSQQMCQEAARHGVRMGVVAQENRVGVALAEASGYGHTALPFAPLEVVPEAPGGVVGSVMRIRVTAQVPNFIGPILAFFGFGTAEPFVVNGTAEMRSEGW
jgi:hypothetical protein